MNLCFRAGYVPVNENSLHKTGLRGRKTYLFWTLIGLLCLLAWSNTVLTVVMFRVLRIGRGMESMEIIPSANLVKFNGLIDLGRVYKPDGNIESFKYESIEISGYRSQISIDIEDNKGFIRNMMNLEHNGTEFNGLQYFEITDPRKHQTVFSTRAPEFRFLEGVRNLNTRSVKTKRITSSYEDKLMLKADSVARLKGNEGSNIEGRIVSWTADQTVYLHSLNGSILLSGNTGLAIKNIPIVTNTGHSLVAQYKVCICMPHGKLFRVPETTDYNSQIACSKVEQSIIHNPCM